MHQVLLPTCTHSILPLVPLRPSLPPLRTQVSGMVVCVYGVAHGTLSIGDTVLFVTMINQLYVPLTFFGSYYRQVRVWPGTVNRFITN